MGTTTFQYQVRDKTGKIVSGTIDAESQAAVAQKLSSMGYATVSISASRHGDEERAEHSRLRRQGEAQGPRGDVAAVRHDDQLRVCRCCGR